MAATDSDAQKIWNIVLGVVGGLIMLGITVVGSLLWQGNASIVRLQSGQEVIVAQVAALQVQFNSATQDRYSGRDADRDKAIVAKLLDALTLRVEGIDTRQRDGLARLRDLELKAGVKPGGS